MINNKYPIEIEGSEAAADDRLKEQKQNWS
jgi:hypothetical protein